MRKMFSEFSTTEYPLNEPSKYSRKQQELKNEPTDVEFASFVTETLISVRQLLDFTISVEYGRTFTRNIIDHYYIFFIAVKLAGSKQLL